MVDEARIHRNLIFFYHKNHNDHFNGTSIYDKAMLDALKDSYQIIAVEPELEENQKSNTKHSNSHYFINLVKQVYFRQIRWLINIFRGKHLTPPENTILLVEDIYCAPIPLLVSKLKGYELIFRAADFGDTYSKSLFDGHPFDRFAYSLFRRLAEGLIIKSASLIICPSRNVESAVISRFPDVSDKVIFLPYVRRKSSAGNEEIVPRDNYSPSKNKVILLFMGDFRYPPNCYAGNYVVNELIPKLNGHSGDYEVLIAGRNSNLLYSNAPNVRVLGAVEDIEGVLSVAHIGLAPMRTVGGLSMKVVDYLTHGLRVVATPEAVNGIEANGQIELAEISHFHIAVENEISHALNNGHSSHRVSEEVASVYLSNKWVDELLRRIDKILKNGD